MARHSIDPAQRRFVRPVLVTGATGFLGAWLCRTLIDRGAQVTAVLRRAPAPDGLFRRLRLDEAPGLRTLVTAAVAPEDLARIDPAAVFHLAGISLVAEAARDIAAAFEVNARNTWLLLDAVRAAGINPIVVLASSDAVYGDAGGAVSREDDAPLGRSPYALSKIAAEAAALAFVSAGLRVVVARIGNVYGPGDPNGARLIPSIVRAVSAGSRPQLRAAKSIRGYLHVRDCAAGLIALASIGGTAVAGRVVNISSDVPVTNDAVARLAASIAGRPDLAPELVGDDAPSERVSSAGLARKLFDWNAAISLSEGLRELMEEPLEYSMEAPLKEERT